LAHRRRGSNGCATRPVSSCSQFGTPNLSPLAVSALRLGRPSPEGVARFAVLEDASAPRTQSRPWVSVDVAEASPPTDLTPAARDLPRVVSVRTRDSAALAPRLLAERNAAGGMFVPRAGPNHPTQSREPGRDSRAKSRPPGTPRGERQGTWLAWLRLKLCRADDSLRPLSKT
jgi:hypothetical protein